MPGNMSGDGTDDFYVTYVEGDSLYLGMTGSDLTSSDVLIYLSVDGSGSDVGYNGLGGAHNLPLSANYVLWAEKLSMDRSFLSRYVNQGFSGGEKKRLEILQLLLLQPDLTSCRAIQRQLDCAC